MPCLASIGARWAVSGKGVVSNANAAINGAEIKRWVVSIRKAFSDVAVPRDVNPWVRSAASLAVLLMPAGRSKKNNTLGLGRRWLFLYYYVY